MSIDVHPGSPPATLHDIPVAADDEFDRDESWAETTITVIAATVTIVFVSFVAVLMAMA
jgi:hypothetical protein